jgi:hypothetical protein
MNESQAHENAKSSGGHLNIETKEEIRSQMQKEGMMSPAMASFVDVKDPCARVGTTSVE